MKLPEITFRLHSCWDRDYHGTGFDVIQLHTWCWGFSFIVLNIRLYIDIGRSWEK